MIQFWYKRNIFNYLLLPLSFLWWVVTSIRVNLKSKHFNSLIICIGNITVGGGGKTPFTIYLFKELSKLGFKVAILSRGYGGQAIKRPLMVNSEIHTAKLVGDEALLMSNTAPVVVCINRVLGVKFLESLGYSIILMDDGFQNPSVHKDINFLLFNTLNPFGNGLIIPAGPLRESLKSAAKRADIVIGVGENNNNLSNLVKMFDLEYITAKIIITSKHDLKLKYLAFAGIAYPDKFFSTLKHYGFKVETTKIFKDHYIYSDSVIKELIALAKKLNLRLITTSKDYVKINPKFHCMIDNLEIELILENSSKNYLKQLILFKHQNKTTIYK